MKDKIKHYAKEIVIFFIFMTLIMNGISLYKSSELNKEPLRPIAVTLIDSQNYSYPKSKSILIHFWATWCPTCKLEASNIETISKNFEVLTIAVNSGDDKSIKEYLHDKELSYKVFNDRDSIFAREFNIVAYPTTFIYDKDKNLLFSEVGFTSTWGLWLRMWWAEL